MKSETSPGTTPGVHHHHAHRRPTGRAKRLALFTALPAIASAAAVWALLDVVGGTPEAPQPLAQQQAPAPADGAVQLVGQVVAISPQSITTRGLDGTTVTFAITPSTTQINTDGDINPATGAAFMVDETVTVLGVVDNGKRVATALADQSASVGNGPPMDGV